MGDIVPFPGDVHLDPHDKDMRTFALGPENYRSRRRRGPDFPEALKAAELNARAEALRRDALELLQEIGARNLAARVCQPDKGVNPPMRSKRRSVKG